MEIYWDDLLGVGRIVHCCTYVWIKRADSEPATYLAHADMASDQLICAESLSDLADNMAQRWQVDVLYGHTLNGRKL